MFSNCRIYNGVLLGFIRRPLAVYFYYPFFKAESVMPFLQHLKFSHTFDNFNVIPKPFYNNSIQDVGKLTYNNKEKADNLGFDNLILIT